MCKCPLLTFISFYGCYLENGYRYIKTCIYFLLNISVIYFPCGIGVRQLDSLGISVKQEFHILHISSPAVSVLLSFPFRCPHQPPLPLLGAKLGVMCPLFQMPLAGLWSG